MKAKFVLFLVVAYLKPVIAEPQKIIPPTSKYLLSPGLKGPYVCTILQGLRLRVI